MYKPQNSRRSGIILIVVLGMLALFSILVVSFVAFSSQSQRSTYAIASREFRKPDVNAFLDNAMMTLLRGTNDTSSPFYGEDLLSDYYGTTGQSTLFVLDAIDMIDARGPANYFPDRRPIHLGNGIVRIPMNMTPFAGVSRAFLDDFLTGAIMTFNEGPLADHTFRVLRSTGVRDFASLDPASTWTPVAEHDPRMAIVTSIYIQLDPSLTVTLGDGVSYLINDILTSGDPYAVAALFYDPVLSVDGSWGENGVDDDSDSVTDNLGEAGYAGATSDQGYEVYFNALPLNGDPYGIVSVVATPNDSWLATKDIVAAFQPNALNSAWPVGTDKTAWMGSRRRGLRRAV